MGLKIPFKTPMDGLQKLSLALLVLILVIFVLSISQMRSTYQVINDVPLKLQRSTAVDIKIKTELGRLGKLEENLKRSSERHSELLRGVDVRMRTSYDADSVKSWRSKAGLLIAQLKQDLDRLRQFNNETNSQLNRLALSQQDLLLQEEMQWTSLQLFLENQADKTVNSEEKGQFYQDYMDEFLETIRALSAYRIAINDFKEKLQALANKGYLKRKDIETNLEIHKNSFQYYLIMSIVSFVLAVVASCGVFGMRIRRERRSRERRQNDRRVDNDRRQNAGGTANDRRQNNQQVENERRQIVGEEANDRRQNDRRASDKRRGIDRS